MVLALFGMPILVLIIPAAWIAVDYPSVNPTIDAQIGLNEWGGPPKLQGFADWDEMGRFINRNDPQQGC